MWPSWAASVNGPAHTWWCGSSTETGQCEKIWVLNRGKSEQTRKREASGNLNTGGQNKMPAKRGEISKGCASLLRQKCRIYQSINWTSSFFSEFGPERKWSRFRPTFCNHHCTLTATGIHLHLYHTRSKDHYDRVVPLPARCFVFSSQWVPKVQFVGHKTEVINTHA